jgi:NitT/TauT family transport system ATP-binding protein
MAWPKPSMSIVSDPTVRLGPDDDPSSPPTVDSAFPIAPEPSARRLVGRRAEHFLTFENADGRVEAFSNVSLQVAEDHFVSFIGPSGCGKTTMLRAIADLQQPSSGTLLVNGVSAENPRLSRTTESPSLPSPGWLSTDLSRWPNARQLFGTRRIGPRSARS